MAAHGAVVQANVGGDHVNEGNNGYNQIANAEETDTSLMEDFSVTTMEPQWTSGLTPFGSGESHTQPEPVAADTVPYNSESTTAGATPYDPAAVRVDEPYNTSAPSGSASNIRNTQLKSKPRPTSTAAEADLAADDEAYNDSDSDSDNAAPEPRTDSDFDVWTIGAGGAVTALSTPEAEYAEMRAKLDSTLRPFRAHFRNVRNAARAGRPYTSRDYF